MLFVMSVLPSAWRSGNGPPELAGPERLESLVITNQTTKVTGLLLSWARGDEIALQQLIPLVHRELHDMARRYTAREHAGHSLQATALVNEAYLRLVDASGVAWHDRAHFLSVCARVMRHILVDDARARHAQKRGGPAAEGHPRRSARRRQRTAPRFCGADEALEALAQFDARKSRVVELRFFGGLSVEETASVLKVSPDTVMRDWKLAKAWLQRQMRGEGSHDA